MAFVLHRLSGSDVASRSSVLDLLALNAASSEGWTHDTALNNLAALFRAQGRYGEAEPPYRRALTIAGKALGLTTPGGILPSMGGADWENVDVPGLPAKKLATIFGMITFGAMTQ
jgi:hypothetical protein